MNKRGGNCLGAKFSQAKMKLGSLMCLIAAAVFTIFLIQTPGVMAATAELSPDDCIKCHDKEPQDIATNGGKHKTEITCLDCHEGHPPKVQDNIPECSQCHSGEKHFELTGCLKCHINPHTPLEISLPDDTTQPCLTCHTEQIAQLKQHESKHTELACTNCHRERHGMIPECQQCHSPHVQGQTQQDCVTCHQAHMPLEVTYPDDLPSSACAACHEDEYDQLAASPFKHHDLTCADCHQKKHKMIPKCQDCHGKPHAEGIHQKFPDCKSCHGNPHNLNKLK